MDTAISKTQADDFASKTEVAVISTKLDKVVDDVKEIKTAVTEIRTDVKGLALSVSMRIAGFITVTVGILGAMMYFFKK